MIFLQEVTLIDAPLQRCFDLSRSVEVHLLDNVHSGAQAVAIGSLTTGLVGLGQSVTWRARHFGLWHEVTTTINALDTPFSFEVTMTRGIFRSMHTTHLFRALTPQRTEMTNLFTVAAPILILGRLAEVLFLRRYMRNLLRERNQVIRRVSESNDWRRYLPAPHSGLEVARP